MSMSFTNKKNLNLKERLKSKKKVKEKEKRKIKSKAKMKERAKERKMKWTNFWTSIFLWVRLIQWLICKKMFSPIHPHGLQDKRLLLTRISMKLSLQEMKSDLKLKLSYKKQWIL